MIRVVGLEKSYGQTKALNSVDLTVSQGEIFGLLGPNGAGKTTLLRILTTLLSPDAGEASVAGHNVVTDAHQVRRSIGVTFQEHALDPALTGQEVLLDSGALYGLSKERLQQRLTDLAPLMNLNEALQRQVKTYSGGMKRRLELARALLAEPRILFLDEPTQGLDPQNRQALWDHLEGLCRRHGITIFLTTHYMEEAEHLAHRVAIIDHGEILAVGSPAQLAADIGGDVIQLQGAGDSRAVAAALADAPFCRWAEVEDDGLRISVANGGADLVPAINLVDQAGFTITNVEVRRPSLNEVFLRLTGRELRD